MLEIGTKYKDINTRINKKKTLMHGPKVHQREPTCINDPNKDELITEKERIKEVSLNHCIKILEKN